MKNLKQVFKVGFIVLIAVMTSCSSDDLSRTAKEYLKEAMSLNFDEAKKYVSQNKTALYDIAKRRYSTPNGNRQDETPVHEVLIKNSATRFTVVNKKLSEDGTTATVTVRISLTHSSIKDRVLSLVKENDKWKVNNENIEDILLHGDILFSKGKGLYIEEQ